MNWFSSWELCSCVPILFLPFNKTTKSWDFPWQYINKDVGNIILVRFSFINDDILIWGHVIQKIFKLLPKIASVAFSISYLRLETPILASDLILFNRRWIVLVPLFVMIPPLSAHWYSPRWRLSFLIDVFVIEPPISLAIIYERNIS